MGALLAGCGSPAPSARESSPPPAPGRKALPRAAVDQKVSELKGELIRGRFEATEERIRGLEQDVGAALPEDYRTFLARHGGTWVTATCPIAEPCPCGDGATIETFYGFMCEERPQEDLQHNRRLLQNVPGAIPIAEGAFGSLILLFVSGERRGSVYFYDAEHRSSWTDEQFHGAFASLAPTIVKYLEMRRSGRLPKKPRTMEDHYHLADSFSEFLERCAHWDLEAQSGGDAVTDDEDDRIQTALARCDVKVLEQFVKAGQINQVDQYGWTPCQTAAAMGNVKTLEYLLGAGADPAQAMCAAANNGRAGAIRFLIDRGCNVEQRRDGKTPLMWAVEFPYELDDHIEAVQVLIEHGADVNARSDDGQSVLEIAGVERYSNGQTRGPEKLIDLLKAAGAKMTSKSP
jgi:hypothetical protein